jgi:hypothetical protein
MGLKGSLHGKEYCRETIPVPKARESTEEEKHMTRKKWGAREMKRKYVVLPDGTCRRKSIRLVTKNFIMCQPSWPPKEIVITRLVASYRKTRSEAKMWRKRENTRSTQALPKTKAGTELKIFSNLIPIQY